MATHYETLGVDPTATAREVESSYRFLAQKFHPDANPTNPDLARQRFKIVQQAFETLTDPKRRREYDLKIGVGLSHDWDPVPMNVDKNGIKFNSDGTLNVGGTFIAADEGVPRRTMGAATLEKDAGPSGEFRVLSNQRLHRFKYVAGRWYAKQLGAAPGPDPRQAANGRDIVTRDSIYPAPSTAFAAPSAVIAVAKPGRPLLKLILFCGVIAAAVAGGYFANHAGGFKSPLTLEEKSKQAQDEGQATAQLAEAERKQQQSLEAQRKQEAAMSKVRLLEVKRQGDHVLASIDQLTSEIDQWDKDIPPLLSNDDGRRLASNTNNMRAFKVLYSKRHPTKLDVAAIHAQVEALVAPINEAVAAGTAISLIEEIPKSLRSRQEEIDKVTTDVRENRESILNLAKLSAVATPVVNTLEQSLVDLAVLDTKNQAEQIAKTETQSRDEAAAEIAKSKKALADAELAKQRAEIDHQTSAVQTKIQHDKDLEEAQTSTVQSALRFFTTAGYYQPGGNNLYAKTTEPHPMSYSKLVAQGALEQTNEGLNKLLYITGYYPNDLRPKWHITNEVMHASPAEMKKITEAQDYLRRLGNVLVELKQLDP